MADQVNGTIKWFNHEKGFGFIEQENGDEIYVHHRQVNTKGYDRISLNEGQKVTFDLDKNERGLRAENVTGL